MSFDRPAFIPLPNYREYTQEQMLERSREYYLECDRRRTVRDFSERPVPLEIIDNAIRTAGTAPSGANMQPWHFVVVGDPKVKQRIREAAEAEEREFYEHRATEQWLEALLPLGTDERKPFLETAPWLIAVFAQTMHFEGEEKIKHYYPVESTGLATGLLISALHHAGLATLTHTPSPMKFLNEILDRPKHERPFLLLVVGYPADNATVPDIRRKTLDEIRTIF